LTRIYFYTLRMA